MGLVLMVHIPGNKQTTQSVVCRDEKARQIFTSSFVDMLASVWTAGDAGGVLL